MLKLCDLAVDFLTLGHGLRADVATIRGRIGSQREKLRDFAQREAEFLRLPNETDALDDIIAVEAVAAALRSRRLLDQPSALVKADCLDADPSPLSDSTDGHSYCHCASL